MLYYFTLLLYFILLLLYTNINDDIHKYTTITYNYCNHTLELIIIIIIDR